MAASDSESDSIVSGEYDIWACDEGHVHAVISSATGKVHLVFADPDEAYNFTQALLRDGYDPATGISPRRTDHGA